MAEANEQAAVLFFQGDESEKKPKRSRSDARSSAKANTSSKERRRRRPTNRSHQGGANRHRASYWKPQRSAMKQNPSQGSRMRSVRMNADHSVQKAREPGQKKSRSPAIGQTRPPEE